MKPVGVLVAFGLVVALSCSRAATPEPGPTGASGHAGEPSVDGVEARFGASDCRACQAEACATPEADCASEAGCARYLDCLDACPVATDGGVEGDCQARCEMPEAASLAILARAVAACRESGHALECPCGERAVGIDLLDQQCPDSQDPNGCYECEDENCCETYAACHEDEQCTGYMACLKACPKSFGQCQVDCASEYPEGEALGRRRTTCVLLRCAEGEQCGEGPLDPCVACINLRCTEEYAGCQLSLPCVRVDTCATQCDTPECYQACYEADPEGALPFQILVGCSVSRCASECG
jgi:hypothetical protein